MAMNSSGPISLAGVTAGVSIQIENGGNGTTQISLNDTAVRNLAGVASGTITMPTDFYGKSNIAYINYTYSSNTANASLNVTSLPGYVAGKSVVTVTVNSGVYLYATSTGSYGLSLSGGTSGDQVILVNNGYIMGCGGQGGSGTSESGQVAGSSGGPALNLGYHTTINNTNGSAYIGGGGGGGGMGNMGRGSAEGGSGQGGGGGGAGGGQGGSTWRYGGYNPGNSTGGSPGSAGANGVGSYGFLTKGGWVDGYSVGGAGGRIFPGSGGGSVTPSTSAVAGGNGGGAGGGGSANGGYYNKGSTVATSGAGGGSNSGGGTAGISGGGFSTFAAAGGGGGGWGASGGAGKYGQNGGPYTGGNGGAGGKAVNLNGYTVTWTSGNTTRVYGTVS